MIAHSPHRQRNHQESPPTTTSNHHRITTITNNQKNHSSPSGKIFQVYRYGYQIYDPRTQSKIQVPIPVHWDNYHSLELTNGKIVVLSWMNQIQNIAEIFVIDTSNFTAPFRDTLIYSQWDAAMVAMPSGKVLITGPYGTEEYDPITHTSQAKAPTNFPRKTHDAILLANGKVLVAGDDTTATEIYDPLLNTWQWGPNLSVVRQYYCQLTQLPNGQVMVSGGSVNTHDTELYDAQTNTLSSGYTLPFTFQEHQVFVTGPDEVLFAVNQNQNRVPFKLNLTTAETKLFQRYEYHLPAAYQNGQLLISNGDYATFYHYEITNKAQQDFHDVHIGTWHDMDLGNYHDDYIGCDPSLQLAFTYNGDILDDTTYDGYGYNPPAFGSMLLSNGHIDEMTGFLGFRRNSAPMNLPQSPSQYYGYLTGHWANGQHIINNGLDGFPGTSTGPDTDFMYPGDPGWCGPGTGNGGWSEVFANLSPDDRQLLQSMGPIDFLAGQSTALDIAMIYSRANFNDNLGSVCKLRSDASTIKTWWQNTLDRSCITLQVAAPQAQPKPQMTAKIIPNPNNGQFVLQLESPSNETRNIQLLNLQGQVVMRQSMPAGQDTLHLDAKEFPKGIYILRIQNPKSHLSMKVVIQ